MLNLDQIKSAIAEIVSSYPVKTVSLFGSYAEDAATENSDVDVIHAPLDENALINPTKVIKIYEQ